MIEYGFIVEAKTIADTYYISNTCPILWSKNIQEAKIFEAYKYAKNDLEDDIITLAASISYSNIKSVWIVEYSKGVEVGREKFI